MICRQNQNDGLKVTNLRLLGIVGLMNLSSLVALWAVSMITCGATGGGRAVGLEIILFSVMVILNMLFLYQETVKNVFIASYLK